MRSSVEIAIAKRALLGRHCVAARESQAAQRKDHRKGGAKLEGLWLWCDCMIWWVRVNETGNLEGKNNYTRGDQRRRRIHWCFISLQISKSPIIFAPAFPYPARHVSSKPKGFPGGIHHPPLSYWKESWSAEAPISTMESTEIIATVSILLCVGETGRNIIRKQYFEFLRFKAAYQVPAFIW